MSNKVHVSMPISVGLSGIESVINEMESGDEVKFHNGDHWEIDIAFNGDSYHCIFGDDSKSYKHEYSNKYELMWDIALADEWGGV